VALAAQKQAGDREQQREQRGGGHAQERE